MLEIAWGFESPSSHRFFFFFFFFFSILPHPLPRPISDSLDNHSGS